MTNLDQIKTLMKSGDVAGAEALFRKALVADPDNAELKMCFGLCRQLQGDEETFRRIHDELAPEMEKSRSAATLSLWRKYHKLWPSLIIGAPVIGGAFAFKYVLLGVLVLAPALGRAMEQVAVVGTAGEKCPMSLHIGLMLCFFWVIMCGAFVLLWLSGFVGRWMFRRKEAKK